MLKDKLSSDKKFLLIAFLKVLIAQPILLLSAIFFTGGGHGIYIQFPIFYGWLLLPFSVNYSLNTGSTIGTDLSIYPFFVPVIFFIFCIFLMSAICFNIVKKRTLRMIVIIHFIGAFTSVIFANVKGKVWTSPFLLFPDSSFVGIIAVIISFVISFLFWRIFFKAQSIIKGSGCFHKP